MSAYFAWTRYAGQAALLAGLAVCVTACGLDAQADSIGGAGGATGGAGGGGGTVHAPVITLLILDSTGTPYTPRQNDTVTREPREVTEVTVNVSEPGHTVRFALLPNDPSATSADMLPGDAALDETEVATDEDGVGRVFLTAPSRPTTFLLRASIGTLASQQIRFAVEGKNVASLEVVPLYEGRRSVERWTAKATPGRTCAEIAADPPEDREYEHSSAGESVLIEGVPTGVPLAVSLRAEHFAWGCADVAEAFESGTPQRVEVVVTDVQIQLEKSRVELVLDVDSLGAWNDALALPLPDVVTALRAGAADDVEALLDAMQEELDDAATPFATKRESDEWDTRLRDALGERAADVLSAPFETWLARGLAELDGDGAFRGVLRAGREATAPPELELESVFGHAPEKAGFSVENRGTWSATADVVLIGTTLEFNPHAFLVTSAQASAVAASEGARTTAEALAELLSCGLVADALQAAAQCGGDCEELCVEGLERLVDGAVKPPKKLAKLAIAVSGAARVGPDAELDRLDGSWLGKLELGGETSDVNGAARAESE